MKKWNSILDKFIYGVAAIGVILTLVGIGGIIHDNWIKPDYSVTHLVGEVY